MARLRTGNLTAADWQQIAGAVHFNEELYEQRARGASGAASVCTCEVGTFLSPTDTPTATQTVSLSMTDTPKAVIIWTSGQTSAGASTVAIFGIGVSAGNANSATVACGSGDVPGDFTEDINHRNDAVILLVNATGVEVEYADISSFTAGAFNLSWALSSAVAYRYHYLAIAGDDVEANVAQFVAPTSAPPVAQNVAHGLSGVPTGMVGISANALTAPPGDEGGANAIMSVWASDLNIDRFVGLESQNGTGFRAHVTAAAGHAQPDLGTPPLSERSRITDADATNVEFTWSNTAAAEYYYGLFVRGIALEVGTYLSPASGSVVVPTTLFDMVGHLHFGAMSPTSDTTEDDGLLFVGASDGSNQASAGIIRPNADTGADRFCSSNKCVTHYNAAATPVLQEEASATHSGSNLTVAFSTAAATANQVSYLAFGCSKSSPADIAGLDLWLRADDVQAADAGLVDSWVSREGNLYEFTAAAADRPTLDAVHAEFNNQATVTFAGAEHLKLSSAPLNTTSGHVFIVAKLASAVASGDLFTSGDEATNNNAIRFLSATATTDFAVWQNEGGTADFLRSSGSGLGTTDSYIFEYSSTGGTYTLILDGATQSKQLETGSDTGDWFGDVPGKDNTTIGAWIRLSGEVANFSGDIAEIIVYDDVLSTADAALVRAYLGARYGITVS